MPDEQLVNVYCQAVVHAVEGVVDCEQEGTTGRVLSDGRSEVSGESQTGRSLRTSRFSTMAPRSSKTNGMSRLLA